MNITNLDYLRTFSENDRLFMADMVRMFINNTPAYIAEMEDNLNLGNFENIGRIAHKMKPSFSFMGIDSGKQLVLSIEKDIPNNADLKEAKEKIEALKVLCQKAYDELKTSLKELE